MGKSAEESISTANPENAEYFMRWIRKISETYNSPKKETLLNQFITRWLSPEIAWEIIQDRDHFYLDLFKSKTKSVTGAQLTLYTKATKEKKYPEAYADTIQALIMLYQNKNEKTIALNILFDLLYIPEFRKAFKDDQKFAPLFMSGFFTAIIKYINEQCKNADLAEELLAACKPREPDPNVVKEELMRILKYKTPLTPEQEDMIAIQRFLVTTTPNSEIMKQLELLEGELEKTAGTRYDPEKKQLEGYQEGQPYKHHRLLSDFLKKWAEQNGFTGYGKLRGFQSEKSFFNFLAKGGLFKDPAFRGDFHGDFTHFIQWYLIAMWNKSNPQQLKLNCEPAHLMRWIGENVNVLEWGRTFEVAPKSLYRPGPLDFRAVDSLHQFLNSPACQDTLPVLHQLNMGRSAKGNRDITPDDEATFESFPNKKNGG